MNDNVIKMARLMVGCKDRTCEDCLSQSKKLFGDNKCALIEYAEVLDKAGYRKIDGDTSDGYHTYNELYHHRAVLFTMICNQNKEIAWKSKKHSDGTMFDNMFIVGIETPVGQATYHYDIEPYWDYFNVKELDNAPLWDGHTAEQAIERIRLMADDAPIVCTKAEVVKEFAEQLKKELFAKCVVIQTISNPQKEDMDSSEAFQIIKELAEQYGKEE